MASERLGPTVSLSCVGCKHYGQTRYVVQGDSGYDKFCRFSAPSREMPEIGGTPAWCPVLARLATASLTGDDLSVLSDLASRITANFDNWPEPLHRQHLAALDKLLARGGER